MARDTTHITNAAADFDGYATTLRTLATTLGNQGVATWTSTSADTYRNSLVDLQRHLGTLAGRADTAAASLRAHATAVGSSVVADNLDRGTQGLVDAAHWVERQTDHALGGLEYVATGEWL